MPEDDVELLQVIEKVQHLQKEVEDSNKLQDEQKPLVDQALKTILEDIRPERNLGRIKDSIDSLRSFFQFAPELDPPLQDLELLLKKMGVPLSERRPPFKQMRKGPMSKLEPGDL